MRSHLSRNKWTQVLDPGSSAAHAHSQPRVLLPQPSGQPSEQPKCPEKTSAGSDEACAICPWVVTAALPGPDLFTEEGQAPCLQRGGGRVELPAGAK